MTMLTERGLYAAKVPGGSHFQVRVEVESESMATIDAAPLFKPAGKTAVKLPAVGSAGLVDQPFTITIEPGSFFRLLLEISYLSTKVERVVVRARATDPEGGIVSDVDTGASCDFACEYFGRIGGDNGQDHVTIFVGGAT